MFAHRQHHQHRVRLTHMVPLEFAQVGRIRMSPSNPPRVAHATAGAQLPVIERVSCSRMRRASISGSALRKTVNVAHVARSLRVWQYYMCYTHGDRYVRVSDGNQLLATRAASEPEPELG